MRRIRRLRNYLLTFILLFQLLFTNTICVIAQSMDVLEVNGESLKDLGLTSNAYILIESTTGKVLIEKNADEIVSPASITKIMTLILIFEAIEQEKISLDDMVTTSEYAKSMGGSQVFLETGEQQTVDTLIKCIIIASGNDASVAMAEHISGSEAEFINRMNQKAAELGMNNTVFKDCCGLYDTMDHHTTARDVAIMSRELITKYPQVKNYSKIWMEDITHQTAKGSSTFTLANTNKLLKQYEWTTGLKTGSTSLAKYCLSATACKNDIELIAVIMGAPNYKVRFSEAIQLLNYGFSNISMYKDVNNEMKDNLKIDGGTKDKIEICPKSQFSYICTENENMELITKKIVYNKKTKAPVKKNDVVGEIKYFIGEKEIGFVPIISNTSVRKAGYIDYFKKLCYKYIL